MVNPKPVSPSQFAKLVGCSASAVSQAINGGRLAGAVVDPKAKRKKLHLDRAVALWKNGRTRRKDLPADFAPAAAGEAQATGIPALDESRKKDAHFQALLREIEYERERGRLVESRKVASAARHAGEIISRGLTELPQRVAPELIGLESIEEIQAILESAVVSVLKQFEEHCEARL